MAEVGQCCGSDPEAWADHHLRGHDFGPGPITAARPGSDPPAGGAAPADGTKSIVPSTAEPTGRELSKILFGNVRAMERNLSSYPARIDLELAASAVLSKITGHGAELLRGRLRSGAGYVGRGYRNVERYCYRREGADHGVRRPDRSCSDQPDRSSDQRHPYQAPLRYRDPNTARVVDNRHKLAFVDGWDIRRAGSTVLVSNAVPVTIATSGEDRMRTVASAAAAPAGTVTGRSARDQSMYMVNRRSGRGTGIWRCRISCLASIGTASLDSAIRVTTHSSKPSSKG